MKTFSKYLTILLVSGVFYSCNGNKSEDSLQKFLENEKRLTYIHSVLVEKNIIRFQTDKQRAALEELAPYNFCYQAIEHIIMKNSSGLPFSKSDSIDNFQHVIGWLIPTLYYSYSPENYSEVPEEYREKANSFIINHCEYYYSFGADKFKTVLRKWLNTNNDKDTLLFNFYTENGDREALAVGKWDVKSYYDLIGTAAWYHEFQLADFEKLSPTEQKMLLSKLILFSLDIQANRSTYWEIETTCGIIEYWEANKDEIMKIHSISSMNRAASMEKFTSVIRSEIQKRFKRTV